MYSLTDSTLSCLDSFDLSLLWGGALQYIQDRIMVTQHSVIDVCVSIFNLATTIYARHDMTTFN